MASSDSKKTIAILGAGIAAMPVIRQVMRNTVLPGNDWKLVVVAPNTHLHYPIAMPRVIVPGQIPDDKVFVPIDLQFRQYKDQPDKFEFIQGRADGLDPHAKTLTVTEVTANESGDGVVDSPEPRTVSYDKLVIMTGSSSVDGLPWKTLGSTEETRAVVAKLQRDIAAAKTIVVAGGGATGTETAGELGSEYGRAGNATKKIYFIYSGHLPLEPQAMVSVQKQARTELERLNVRLIANTKVTGTTTDPETGATTLELTANDGKVTSLTTDVYIPSMGVKPNSSFAPPEMLDRAGQIKQTISLQAQGHPDIYIAGDVGSLESSNYMMATAQAHHLCIHLPPFLSGGTPIPDYKLDLRDILLVTIGRSKATGQMKGWKIPGFLIYFMKGRDMFLGQFDNSVMGTKVSNIVLEK